MKFYRADNWSSYSGFGYYFHIYYIEFELIKETPCGYWIKEITDGYKFGYRYRDGENKKIWVTKNGKNRIAYPTKKEALFNLYKRRQRYIEILESRLKEQKQLIYEIENKLKEHEEIKEEIKNE